MADNVTETSQELVSFPHRMNGFQQLKKEFKENPISVCCIALSTGLACSGYAMIFTAITSSENKALLGCLGLSAIVIGTLNVLCYPKIEAKAKRLCANRYRVTPSIELEAPSATASPSIDATSEVDVLIQANEQKTSSDTPNNSSKKTPALKS